MKGTVFQKKVRVAAVSALIVLLIVGSVVFAPQSVENAYATGNGTTVVNRYTVGLFTGQKTLDLTDSSADIRVTESDKAKLMAEADEAVMKWLVASSLIEINCYDGEDEEARAKLKASFGFDEVTDGIPFYSPKYWYEDKYPAVIRRLGEIIDNDYGKYDRTLIDNIKKISEMKTLTELLETKDESLQEFVTEYTGGDAVGSLNMRAKREEIYNDKFSDFLVAKLKGLYADFKFDVIPLAEDGSEDEAYKIGEVYEYMTSMSERKPFRVKRGKLPNDSYRLSTINFGAEDQFYDGILKENTVAFLEDRFHMSSESDEIDLPEGMSWEIGKTIPLGSSDAYYIPRDMRDFITHVLLLDSGGMTSSDRSQTSGSTSTIVNSRGSAVWPGDHCLLEVCDALHTYAWARYAYPKEAYTQTFNLHLNPAVYYYDSYIWADLITDIKFDKDGKITSLSKPVAKEGDYRKFINYLMNNDMWANENEDEFSIYRYKLVESKESDSTLKNGDKVKENTEEKVLDVMVNRNYREFLPAVRVFEDAANADKYYMTIMDHEFNDPLDQSAAYSPVFDYADTDIDRDTRQKEYGYSSITFTNKPETEKPKEEPEEPDIKKTIQGSENFRIEKLTEKFAYRITTSVPKTGSSFEVVDEMDKVLEFIEKEKTSVTIGGKALTPDELKNQLTYKGNELRLRITAEQLQNRAGEEIQIDFRARLVKGADLSGYNGVVPNIAYYVLDGKESSKTGTANVELPKYHSDGSSDDEEESGSGSEETEKSFVKTGDQNHIVIWIILGAAALISVLIIRKKRA